MTCVNLSTIVSIVWPGVLYIGSVQQRTLAMSLIALCSSSCSAFFALILFSLVIELSTGILTCHTDCNLGGPSCQFLFQWPRGGTMKGFGQNASCIANSSKDIAHLHYKYLYSQLKPSAPIHILVFIINNIVVCWLIIT